MYFILWKLPWHAIGSTRVQSAGALNHVEPKLSVTNIVRWLKGISAWQLFRECPELQTSYWKTQDRHLWSPSYYVESIGAVNEQAVTKYIDDQRRKEVKLE